MTSDWMHHVRIYVCGVGWFANMKRFRSRAPSLETRESPDVIAARNAVETPACSSRSLVEYENLWRGPLMTPGGHPQCCRLLGQPVF